MGVWVVLFLALLTFLAWLLKKEYWRDVTDRGTTAPRRHGTPRRGGSGTVATACKGWAAPMRPADSGRMELSDDGGESAHA